MKNRLRELLLLLFRCCFVTLWAAIAQSV